MQTIFKCVLYVAIGLSATACNTADLLLDTPQTKTRLAPVTLIEDQVVAFGRAAQTNNEFSQKSLVIAGQKQSYVITEGSDLLQQLAERLNPQYVKQINDFRFLSKNNDGYFTGAFLIYYSVPKQAKVDPNVQFLLQHGGEILAETETERNYRLHLNISGKVYPPVHNLKSLRSMSRPYKVVIYTEQLEEYKRREGYNFSNSQVLLLTPFVLVFDIVTLPFKLVSGN